MEPQLVEFVFQYTEEGTEETLSEHHTLLVNNTSAGAVMDWASAQILYHNEFHHNRRTLVGIQITQPHRRTGS